MLWVLLLYLSVLPPILGAPVPLPKEADTTNHHLIRKSESTLTGETLQRVLKNNPYLSSHSLQFVSCASAVVERVQHSAPTDQEDGAPDTVEDADDDLQQQYALFRLCPRSEDSGATPNDACSVDCRQNFGEYVVPLQTYLFHTIKYFQAKQQQYCLDCDATCSPDASRLLLKGDPKSATNLLPSPEVDCATCVDECDKIDNMNSNGYIDATVFLSCQMIYDPDGETEAPLYAGPVCAEPGTKIRIGVFKDEECRILDPTKEVDDYLVNSDGSLMKLSHALLRQTYTDTCIACDASNGADGKEDNNRRVCQPLYGVAGKCEPETLATSSFNEVCEESLTQEPYVCDFIQSLKVSSLRESA